MGHKYWTQLTLLNLFILKVFSFHIAGIKKISTTRSVSEQEAKSTAGKEDQTKASVRHDIVFVTSEAAPYSKTGGLGDVCGSLPIALAARGHRVMVVSPRYVTGFSDKDKNFARVLNLGRRIKIYCFGEEHEVTYFHEYRAGVDWVLNFSNPIN